MSLRLAVSSGWRGRKRVEVDAVGDSDDAVGGQAGLGDEGVSGVLGTGENAVGQAVGQVFRVRRRRGGAGWRAG